ncbi:MAG: two pore domain potassium channel family protein [Trueperaceae bacterium]|nr:MAG: two pore domain potassium channel family protein [Trueperaceae bacterium]
MMPFLLIVISFFRVLRHAFKDREFRSLAVFVFAVIVFGAVFYWRVENWRFLDALYFSVVTLATVGYGDMTPETDAGKVFTVLYILSGIGVLAAFATALVSKGRESFR